MDYRCRFGSLCNSSTASGRSDPGETVAPSYCLGLRYVFFHSCPLYFFPYSLLSAYLFFALYTNVFQTHTRMFSKHSHIGTARMKTSKQKKSRTSSGLPSLPGSLLSEAVDELPNEPNLNYKSIHYFWREEKSFFCTNYDKIQ